MTAEILGMAGEDRRPSAVLSANPFIKITDTSLSTESEPSEPRQIVERTPSPTEDMLSAWKPPSSKMQRNRVNSENSTYAETEVEELMSMLRDADSLEEQGDILQYLVCFIKYK